MVLLTWLILVSILLFKMTVWAKNNEDYEKNSDLQVNKLANLYDKYDAVKPSIDNMIKNDANNILRIQNDNKEIEENYPPVDHSLNYSYEIKDIVKEIEMLASLLNNSIGENVILSKNKPFKVATNKMDRFSEEAKVNGKSVEINDIDNSNKDFRIPETVDYKKPDKVSSLKLKRVITVREDSAVNNQDSSTQYSNAEASKHRSNAHLYDTKDNGNESVLLMVNKTKAKQPSGFDRIRKLLKNRHGNHEDRFLPGSHQNDARRMVGGRHASISEYPYTVSIEKNGKHTCTGSIITSYLIVSTASCVWRSSRGRSLMKVRAGSTDWSSGGVLIPISEVMKHPKYDVTKDPDFDVSVLKLVTPIKFTYDRSPLELPPKGAVPAFKDAWITGWGSRVIDGRMLGETMMEVFHAKYIEHTKCARSYGKIINVSPNSICFGPFDPIERGPCIADSGAPAVSDFYLWGVASYGLRGGCGDKNYPAVFTSIASPEITDFIQRMISRHEDRLGNLDISLERKGQNSTKDSDADKNTPEE